MRGIDISHWNQNVKYNNYDFVIIKASEGVNYKDPALDSHYDGLHGKSDGKPDSKKLYGFYHYARPDLGNTSVTEAKSFLSYTGHHAGNCIYALDWEGKALEYNPTWALEFLNYVKSKTGSNPLLYISASQENTRSYKAIRKAGFPLWIAHWYVDKPSVKDWDEYTLWQYSSSPIDMNEFNGNKEDWFNLCGKKTTKPTTLEIGDKVKVKTRKDYNGVVNDSWVLNYTFTVMEMKKDRVVIGTGKAITGAWNIKDLERVE